MDIGSIFLLTALLILVVLYVSQPIVAKRIATGNTPRNKIDHDLSTLLAEKERILEALEELDFDYELGKIPEPEYPEQRGEMLKRGAEILRQLDNLQVQSSAGHNEASIEATIAARRTKSHQPDPVSPANEEIEDFPEHEEREKEAFDYASADDDLEMLIASRRRARESKSGGFCPQCGKPLHKSDRFCSKCGKSLV